jgi:AcrR family transcriptional regulator
MDGVAQRNKQSSRMRMTGRQRREQLVSVARSVFAEKGFEPASVEEIAARAEVSKPVVYEHFGGKEGIYAVVVDREVQDLSNRLTAALGVRDHPKRIVERTALTLLDYIENNEDGFRILVRDSPVAQAQGPFSSMLGDLARTVEGMLAAEFEDHDLDPATAPLYAQMLVGMIAFTGQWWLEAKHPDKAAVAAHLTNLGWNGLRGMEREPHLKTLDAQ